MNIMPVFVSFNHGRENPLQDMEEMGDVGPLLGPVNIALTYHNLKVLDVEWGDFVHLKGAGDCILMDGLYYGDVEIWESTDPKIAECIAEGRKVLTFQDILKEHDPNRKHPIAY